MRAGPLAGVLAGLARARQTQLEALVTLPVDTPFAPRDLASRLRMELEQGRGDIILAASASLYPVAGLWPLACETELHEAFAKGLRAPRDLASQFRISIVRWAVNPFDPFSNLNEEEDRAQLEAIAALDDIAIAG